jgi:TPR repeat protein
MMKLVADQGNPNLNLSWYCHYNGEGVEQDLDLAMFFTTQESGNQEDTAAQHNLAKLHFREDNLPSALFWLEICCFWVSIKR